MKQLIEQLQQRARQLKIEVCALYLAYQDLRVPKYARVFAACVVGYAFSPIDLIPDFIPVIGHPDDLILIPLGTKMALSMIPVNLMNESHEKAQEIISPGKPINQVAAVVIVSIWLLVATLANAFTIRVFKNGH